MSLGDDHHSSGDYGGAGQTRLRLPEEEGGPRRGGRSSSRSLVTVVGVVVLLIAAIAFANRGGDDSASAEGGDGDKPKTSSTAPSGTRPVRSGFAHDEQGAQSAAANYAVALGSDGMFDKARRHEIVNTVYAPHLATARQADLDGAYSNAEFLANIGLDKNGKAPAGQTFVSRVIPVGTKVTASSAEKATVEVWYTSLFGLSGGRSTNPVTESWYTTTYQLTWTNDDWKVTDFQQKDGPVPVGRDQRASTADDMTKAVEEYGGFTYAR
ncbi:Integral membrane protein OS=Streptomyces tendae OX=1932 GN=GUR47_25575 PE=4 SV=1 [Streptomyces tendae]